MEPVFYDILVFKFKRTVGKANLVINSKNNQILFKKMDIKWISCDSLVVKSTMIYSYDFLFNHTMVGQASDSMMALV